LQAKKRISLGIFTSLVRGIPRNTKELIHKDIDLCNKFSIRRV